MNPFWLILIFPFYAFMGGLTGSRIHNGKGHNKGRCDRGDDPPWCILGGVFWPVVPALLIMFTAVNLGIDAEAMRPARRKEKSREITEAHEREIYGKVLPK